MAEPVNPERSSHPIDPSGQFDRVGLCKTCRFVRLVASARGSIFYPKNAAGQTAFGAPDIVEVPPGNSTSTNAVYQVRIDQMTGRPRIEKLEVQ